MGTSWAAATLVALVATGCEARLVLGAGCTLTSECPAPLVCVAGRCRSGCATARDCPRGAVCLSGEGGVRACELETVDACTTSATCGARLLCLEGRCTNECTGDAECVAGARCHPSAGCVECVADLDCPLAFRCGAAHTCEPECASDADCAGGLVCRSDRCVLATGDAGASDAAVAPIDNDRCEDAFVVPLLPAPQDLVVRVAASAWSDGAPSCTLAPDGYLALESTERALAVIARIDESSAYIGEVDDCGSGVLDCSQIFYGQMTAVLEPGRTTLAVDDEPGSNRIEVSVRTTRVGPETLIQFVPPDVVDLFLVLGGEGNGSCGSGPAPDALLFTAVSSSGTGHLIADAPGVELQWVILDSGADICTPAAVGHAETDLFVVAGQGPYSYARLVARGATGPVTVHLTGNIVF